MAGVERSVATKLDLLVSAGPVKLIISFSLFYLLVKITAFFMGLDIYHYKLTFKPKDPEDYILVEEWEQTCNVPFEHYKMYLEQKWIEEVFYSITVLKTEADKKKYLDIPIFIFDGTESILVEENCHDIDGQIAALITEHGLLDYKQDDSLLSVDNIPTRTIFFCKDVLKDVVYYEECGYQRKGMNNTFYKHFKKYEYFGKMEDFELAYSCVSVPVFWSTSKNEVLKDLRAAFFEQFVVRYEVGRSLLHASF